MWKYETICSKCYVIFTEGVGRLFCKSCGEKLPGWKGLFFKMVPERKWWQIWIKQTKEYK